MGDHKPFNPCVVEKVALFRGVTAGCILPCSSASTPAESMANARPAGPSSSLFAPTLDNASAWSPGGGVWTRRGGWELPRLRKWRRSKPRTPIGSCDCSPRRRRRWNPAGSKSIPQGSGWRIPGCLADRGGAVHREATHAGPVPRRDAAKGEGERSLGHDRPDPDRRQAARSVQCTVVAEQWYSKTALPELLGVPAVAMDDSRLCRFWISCCPTSRPWNVISKNGRGDSLDSGPICCSLM